MSRFLSDEEENMESPDYRVNDILAEIFDDMLPEAEQTSPPRRSLSRSSADALRPAEESEESVRIYQPRRDRRETQERLASRWGKEAPAPEDDRAIPSASETEAYSPAEKPRPDLKSLASGFLSRLRSETKPRVSRVPASPEELPSFDELLWGKKEEPVRIEEEEDAAPAPEPVRPAVSAPLRRAAPEVDVHIPEAELSGLSVDAILAEYWGGLEESTAPVEPQPLPRRRRQQEPPVPAEKPRAFFSEKAKTESKRNPFQDLLGAVSKMRPSPAKKASPSPVKKAKPVPAPEAEPETVEAPARPLFSEPEPDTVEAPARPLFPAEETPAPAPRPLPKDRQKAEPDVLNMSVNDILSEFWAEYTEPAEQPAPPADAPRSRREAARRREEASSLPPTGAAPSAAENASRRREKEKSSRSASGRESASPAARPARRKGAAERSRKDLPSAAEEAPVPEAGQPEPLAPSEAAETFGFLRRDRREEAPPAKKEQAAPPSPRQTSSPPAKQSPSPSPRRREIKDEDVEFSAMSVDDILAEYNDILAAIPAAAEVIGEERKAEPARRAEPASPAAAPSPSPRSGKGGRVSRMEEEARDILQQMRGDSFSSHSEDSRSQSGLRRRQAEAPAPEPMPASPAEEAAGPVPDLTAADWSESLRRLLDQDPAPPQPAASVEPSRKEGSELARPKPARSYIPSEEIDPRFNLSGERKSTMVFDGRELDLSADESYVPPKPSGNVGFHWVAGEEELPEKPLEKKSLFRKGTKKAPAAEAEAPEYTEGYDDLRRPEYAPDLEYDEEDGDDPNAFPSFGQYLSGMASSLLVRLFGARRSRTGTASTMEDESEDLGPEVSPATASKYYGSFVTSLRMRVRIGLVLLAVLTWITLGLPVSGALRTVEVAAGLSLAIQLTILLLGLDVVTGSLMNLARGRFGADSLAVLTCILTSLDALSVCLGFMGTPHMPLCLISSLSFLGVLMSSLASARGLRKALRVPAIGKRCYAVTAEPDVKGNGLTLLKSMRPPKGFVRRTEEAAPDETAFNRLSPVLGILAVLMALVVAIAKHAFPEYLYILTVILCPAVPIMALLCFALPFLFGSLRIFHSGAAIAGWSGISDIGSSDNLIVTDRDLFPEGSVEIDTVRIFAEVQPETIISYAGTMICASGSDLAPCFSQLMEKNNCSMRRVEGFENLSGGGMKGVIDGSVILCGGLDLMRLMNVRVPYRLVGRTTVLLAVDGILCGIFNMKYEGQPQVRKALVGLIRSNRHPIFAIRDFLVTPEMLSDCFEVATDGYDFPPYVDRFAISEAKPSADSKPAAVVCREGLGPLVHMADTARSLYLSVRINLLLTILAAVLGVFVVFFKLLSAGVVSAGFLLLFLLLWSLPVLLISAFLRL